MGHALLNGLSVNATENRKARNINSEEIVKSSAKMKGRKVEF
jgi:hypothetical protein